jgi:hypothetical protein
LLEELATKPVVGKLDLSINFISSKVAFLLFHFFVFSLSLSI